MPSAGPRRYSHALVALVLLACQACDISALSPGLQSRTRAAERWLAGVYPRQAPGGAVAVTAGGRIVMTRGYGLAGTDPATRIGRATRFRLGSLTKQFTAAVILQLAEARALRLDDPVTHYVPELQPLAQGVKLAHLLSHTAGLRSYTLMLAAPTWWREGLQPHVLLQALRSTALDFPPGTRFAYSDTGYYLLGLVIERVTGQPYPTVLRRRLFEPLRLKHTSVDDGRPAAGRALGYEATDRGVQAAARTDMSTAFAAGDIASSVGDVARWNVALSSPGVLGAAQLTRMFTPMPRDDGSSSGYSCGWMFSEHRGVKFIEHGGTIAGFENHVVRVPDQDLTVTVLSNCAGCRPRSIWVATRLVEWLHPELGVPPQGGVGCTAAHELTGAYAGPSGRRAVIACRGTALVLRLGEQPAQALEYDPKRTDSYTTADALRAVRVSRDPRGHVSAITVAHRFGGEERLTAQPDGAAAPAAEDVRP